MPIIKILNSSKNFSAVLYNESRVEKGEASLLDVSNFDIPINNAAGFIAYLNKWSNRSKRIKNPQLHVVISLKGKVANNDALLSIAKEWLSKMGYADNPYLIYLHENTGNSHIHIVTTRIGPDGKKVDHNFERKKSQRILNEINGVDKLKELRNYIADLLRFSFSTKTQFIELCKNAQIVVEIDNDNIKLSKDGSSVNLSSDLVEFCSKRYHKNLDIKTKKSIQAKIFKYANLLDKDTFQSYMRKNFGLNFIFYGKGEHIYGFSIIDYKNRSVYKGSEIFSLKKLNELFVLENKTYQDRYNLYIKDLLRSNKFADLIDVNDMLMKEGVYTDGSSYYEFPNNDLSGYLDSKLAKKIQYNTRVNKILRDYKPQTISEKKVLSKIYHIPLKDLNRPLNYSSDNDSILYYKGMIEDLLLNKGDLRSTLDLYGIEVHYLSDSFVIRDSSNKVVISNDRLGVDYNLFKSAMYSVQSKYDIGQKFEDEYVGFDYDYEPEVLFVDIVSDLLSIRAGVSGGNGRKKKKH